MQLRRLHPLPHQGLQDGVAEREARRAEGAEGRLRMYVRAREQERNVQGVLDATSPHRLNGAEAPETTLRAVL